MQSYTAYKFFDTEEAAAAACSSNFRVDSGDHAAVMVLVGSRQIPWLTFRSSVSPLFLGQGRGQLFSQSTGGNVPSQGAVVEVALTPKRLRRVGYHDTKSLMDALGSQESLAHLRVSSFYDAICLYLFPTSQKKESPSPIGRRRATTTTTMTFRPSDLEDGASYVSGDYVVVFDASIIHNCRILDDRYLNDNESTATAGEHAASSTSLAQRRTEEGVLPRVDGAQRLRVNEKRVPPELLLRRDAEESGANADSENIHQLLLAVREQQLATRKALVPLSNLAASLRWTVDAVARCVQLAADQQLVALRDMDGESSSSRSEVCFASDTLTLGGRVTSMPTLKLPQTTNRGGDDDRDSPPEPDADAVHAATQRNVNLPSLSLRPGGLSVEQTEQSFLRAVEHSLASSSPASLGKMVVPSRVEGLGQVSSSDADVTAPPPPGTGVSARIVSSDSDDEAEEAVVISSGRHQRLAHGRSQELRSSTSGSPEVRSSFADKSREGVRGRHRAQTMHVSRAATMPNLVARQDLVDADRRGGARGGDRSVGASMLHKKTSSFATTGYAATEESSILGATDSDVNSPEREHSVPALTTLPELLEREPVRRDEVLRRFHTHMGVLQAQELVERTVLLEELVTTTMFAEVAERRSLQYEERNELSVSFKRFVEAVRSESFAQELQERGLLYLRCLDPVSHRLLARLWFAEASEFVEIAARRILTDEEHRRSDIVRDEATRFYGTLQIERFQAACWKGLRRTVIDGEARGALHLYSTHLYQLKCLQAAECWNCEALVAPTTLVSSPLTRAADSWSSASKVLLWIMLTEEEFVRREEIQRQSSDILVQWLAPLAALHQEEWCQRQRLVELQRVEFVAAVSHVSFEGGEELTRLGIARKEQEVRCRIYAMQTAALEPLDRSVRELTLCVQSHQEGEAIRVVELLHREMVCRCAVEDECYDLLVQHLFDYGGGTGAAHCELVLRRLVVTENVTRGNLTHRFVTQLGSAVLDSLARQEVALRHQIVVDQDHQRSNAMRRSLDPIEAWRRWELSVDACHTLAVRRLECTETIRRLFLSQREAAERDDKRQIPQLIAAEHVTRARIELRSRLDFQCRIGIPSLEQHEFLARRLVWYDEESHRINNIAPRIARLTEHMNALTHALDSIYCWVVGEENLLRRLKCSKFLWDLKLLLLVDFHDEEVFDRYFVLAPAALDSELTAARAASQRQERTARTQIVADFLVSRRRCLETSLLSSFSATLAAMKRSQLANCKRLFLTEVADYATAKVTSREARDRQDLYTQALVEGEATCRILLRRSQSAEWTAIALAAVSESEAVMRRDTAFHEAKLRLGDLWEPWAREAQIVAVWRERMRELRQYSLVRACVLAEARDRLHLGAWWLCSLQRIQRDEILSACAASLQRDFLDWLSESLEMKLRDVSITEEYLRHVTERDRDHDVVNRQPAAHTMSALLRYHFNERRDESTLRDSDGSSAPVDDGFVDVSLRTVRDSGFIAIGHQRLLLYHVATQEHKRQLWSWQTQEWTGLLALWLSDRHRDALWSCYLDHALVLEALLRTAVEQQRTIGHCSIKVKHEVYLEAHARHSIELWERALRFRVKFCGSVELHDRVAVLTSEASLRWRLLRERLVSEERCRRAALQREDCLTWEQHVVRQEEGLARVVCKSQVVIGLTKAQLRVLQLLESVLRTGISRGHNDSLECIALAREQGEEYWRVHRKELQEFCRLQLDELVEHESLARQRRAAVTVHQVQNAALAFNERKDRCVVEESRDRGREALMMAMFGQAREIVATSQEQAFRTLVQLEYHTRSSLCCMWNELQHRQYLTSLEAAQRQCAAALALEDCEAVTRSGIEAGVLCIKLGSIFCASEALHRQSVQETAEGATHRLERYFHHERVRILFVLDATAVLERLLAAHGAVLAEIAWADLSEQEHLYRRANESQEVVDFLSTSCGFVEGLEALERMRCLITPWNWSYRRYRHALLDGAECAALRGEEREVRTGHIANEQHERHRLERLDLVTRGVTWFGRLSRLYTPLTIRILREATEEREAIKRAAIHATASTQWTQLRYDAMRMKIVLEESSHRNAVVRQESQLLLLVSLDERVARESVVRDRIARGASNEFFTTVQCPIEYAVEAIQRQALERMEGVTRRREHDAFGCAVSRLQLVEAEADERRRFVTLPEARALSLLAAALVTSEEAIHRRTTTDSEVNSRRRLTLFSDQLLVQSREQTERQEIGQVNVKSWFSIATRCVLDTEALVRVLALRAVDTRRRAAHGTYVKEQQQLRIVHEERLMRQQIATEEVALVWGDEHVVWKWNAERERIARHALTLHWWRQWTSNLAMKMWVSQREDVHREHLESVALAAHGRHVAFITATASLTFVSFQEAPSAVELLWRAETIAYTNAYLQFLMACEAQRRAELFADWSDTVFDEARREIGIVFEDAWRHGVCDEESNERDELAHEELDGRAQASLEQSLREVRDDLERHVAELQAKNDEVFRDLTGRLIAFRCLDETKCELRSFVRGVKRAKQELSRMSEVLGAFGSFEENERCVTFAEHDAELSAVVATMWKLHQEPPGNQLAPFCHSGVGARGIDASARPLAALENVQPHGSPCYAQASPAPPATATTTNDVFQATPPPSRDDVARPLFSSSSTRSRRSTDDDHGDATALWHPLPALDSPHRHSFNPCDIPARSQVVSRRFQQLDAAVHLCHDSHSRTLYDIADSSVQVRKQVFSAYAAEMTAIGEEGLNAQALSTEMIHHVKRGTGTATDPRDRDSVEAYHAALAREADCVLGEIDRGQVGPTDNNYHRNMAERVEVARQEAKKLKIERRLVQREMVPLLKSLRLELHQLRREQATSTSQLTTARERNAELRERHLKLLAARNRLRLEVSKAKRHASPQSARSATPATPKSGRAPNSQRNNSNTQRSQPQPFR